MPVNIELSLKENIQEGSLVTIITDNKKKITGPFEVQYWDANGHLKTCICLGRENGVKRYEVGFRI